MHFMTLLQTNMTIIELLSLQSLAIMDLILRLFLSIRFKDEERDFHFFGSLLPSLRISQSFLDYRSPNAVPVENLSSSRI